MSIDNEFESTKQPSEFEGYSFNNQNIPKLKEVLQITEAPPGSVSNIGTTRHHARTKVVEYISQEDTLERVLVIAKPLEKEQFKVESEVYRHLNNFPDLPLLRVAYFISDYGRFGMATIAEPDLISIEQMILNAENERVHTPEGEKRFYDTIKYYCRISALAIFRLNQCGVYHYDAAVRNVGVKNLSGVALAFDFEEADVLKKEGRPLEKRFSMLNMGRLFADFATEVRNCLLLNESADIIEETTALVEALYDDPLFGTYGWTAEKEQKAKQLLGL